MVENALAERAELSALKASHQKVVTRTIRRWYWQYLRIDLPDEGLGRTVDAVSH
jgi:hypothetical protein